MQGSNFQAYLSLRILQKILHHILFFSRNCLFEIVGISLDQVLYYFFNDWRSKSEKSFQESQNFLMQMNLFNFLFTVVKRKFRAVVLNLSTLVSVGRAL